MGIILILVLLGLALYLNAGGFGERWRGAVGRALKPAFVVGAVGFAAGFFGPIVFAPEANQGPLLGIFITGPIGFLVGLVYGLVREAR